MVKKLDALGCPWDESAAIAALEEDHSNCLEYLTNQRGMPTRSYVQTGADGTPARPNRRRCCLAQKETEI